MPNLVLDGAAIGVIVTAVGGFAQAVVKVAASRGNFRAKAADELLQASKRASEYATALRAICDLLTTDDHSKPPPPEVCRRISLLARNALGLPSDEASRGNAKRVEPPDKPTDESGQDRCG